MTTLYELEQYLRTNKRKTKKRNAHKATNGKGAAVPAGNGAETSYGRALARGFGYSRGFNSPVVDHAPAAGRPQDFEVAKSIDVLRQASSMVCWATVFTMMESWRRQQSTSIETALARVGVTWVELYRANKGTTAEEETALFAASGLEAEPLASPTLEGWESRLRQYGPLWVNVDNDPSDKRAMHAVIVTGIHGDGTTAGTKLSVIDPARGDKRQVPFAEFQRIYEDGATRRTASGRFNQIIHYPKDVAFARAHSRANGIAFGGKPPVMPAPTGPQPWSTFFPFKKGATYSVELDHLIVSWTGAGEVLERTSDQLVLTIDMPPKSALLGEVQLPATKLKIEAVYKREGKGNLVRFVLDGQTFEDKDAEIETRGSKRIVRPKFVGVTDVPAWISMQADGTNRVEMQIPFAGKTYDFDLNHKSGPTGFAFGIEPWSKYFHFDAGTPFKVDGPAGFDGTGRVLERSDAKLKFEINMPEATILTRRIPKLDLIVFATYAKEGAGNRVELTLNGQAFVDTNVTITSSGSRRTILPSISVPDVKLQKVSIAYDSADEIDLDVTIDGREIDLDLERIKPGAKALNRAKTPAPAAVSSTIADAVREVAAFAARTGSTRWKLARADVAKRLDQLVRDADLVDQGALNLCGPAVFFHLWVRRDPAGFARYAAGLFEKGEGVIGTLKVKPSDTLVLNDYASVVPKMAGAVTPIAEWMCLSALRNSEGRSGFEGDPSENVSGITLPHEVAAWMRASGAYTKLTEDAKVLEHKGVAHALALSPTTTRDIALLINANIIPRGSSGRRSLLDAFPNHYIQLLAPAKASGGNVELEYWTWGMTGKQRAKISTADFEANYYGAVTGEV